METAPRSPMRGDDDRLHRTRYLMLPGIPSATPWTTSPACGRGWRARVVPMYAAFSLVRAVLENACAAVWMLQPPQRAERLARRLRFAVTDIRNGEEVKEITGLPGPRPKQDRIQEVRAIAAAPTLPRTPSAAARGTRRSSRLPAAGPARQPTSPT